MLILLAPDGASPLSPDMTAKLLEYGLVGAMVLFLLLERWFFNGKIVDELRAIVVALTKLNDAIAIDGKIDRLSDRITPMRGIAVVPKEPPK